MLVVSPLIGKRQGTAVSSMPYALQASQQQLVMAVARGQSKAGYRSIERPVISFIEQSVATVVQPLKCLATGMPPAPCCSSDHHCL